MGLFCRIMVWIRRNSLLNTNGPTSTSYNQFSVGSPSEEYPLTTGGLAGIGCDGFHYHYKMRFSTQNNDNDESGNCVNDQKSGWCFNNVTMLISTNNLLVYMALCFLAR